MRWAVFSDVHANAVALDAMLRDAAARGAEAFLCLGDVVGYGPQPAEALARVREVAVVTLAGNHDDAVSGRGDASRFIDLAADAVDRHRAVLSRADRRWLATLPYTFDGGTFKAVHGSPDAPEDFNYVQTAEDAATAFARFDGDLLFVGHTHVPALFVTGASGTAHALAPADFVLEPGKRYIVNPGSVGYPRNKTGECFASYVIYDDASRSVYYRYIPFAVSSVLQRGRSRRRPGLLAAVAAGTAILALAAFVRVATRPRETPEATPPRAAAREPLPVHRLTFAPGCVAKVCPQVVLKRASPPLAARLVFRDAAGSVLGAESRTVKVKWTKSYAVPPQAVSAELYAETGTAHLVSLHLTTNVPPAATRPAPVAAVQP